MRPLVVASLPVRSLRDLSVIDQVYDADYIELRLDYLKSLSEVDLEKLIKYKSKLILTIRDTAEGGVNRISEDEKIGFLMEANKKGFIYDIELNFVKKHNFPYEGKIVSVHYFYNLPDLKELKKDIERYSKKALYFKVAVVASNGYKSILSSLLEFTENIAVIPMSEDPLERIAFGILGSKLLYGYITEATAKGQLPYKEIIYIIDNLLRYRS